MKFSIFCALGISSPKFAIFMSSFLLLMLYMSCSADCGCVSLMVIAKRTLFFSNVRVKTTAFLICGRVPLVIWILYPNLMFARSGGLQKLQYDNFSHSTPFVDRFL